ncbi:MAG: hypothetical protein CMM01_14875 [Rhodopirellula sp.]|nr:hypothetical protein [Rhodopirellula sp.]OUX50423.1 MAG: hypothetical protein CBE43_06885 [Rhodopirellula sp. TMED283]
MNAPTPQTLPIVAPISTITSAADSQSGFPTAPRTSALRGIAGYLRKKLQKTFGDRHLTAKKMPRAGVNPTRENSVTGSVCNDLGSWRTHTALRDRPEVNQRVTGKALVEKSPPEA